MILAFFIGFSKTKSISYNRLDFVVTELGIFLPEDIVPALTGKFQTATSQKVIRLKSSNIIWFRINGREFYSKDVYDTQNGMFQKTLLEKISTRGEYTIYKRVLNKDKECCMNNYYLFKGAMQESRLNADNYKVVWSFFMPALNQMLA